MSPSASADLRTMWLFCDEMGLEHGATDPKWAGLVCISQKGVQAIHLSGWVRLCPSERSREPSPMGPRVGGAAGPSLACEAGPGRSHWVICHSGVGFAPGGAANLCPRAGPTRARAVSDRASSGRCHGATLLPALPQSVGSPVLTTGSAGVSHLLDNRHVSFLVCLPASEARLKREGRAVEAGVEGAISTLREAHDQNAPLDRIWRSASLASGSHV